MYTPEQKQRAKNLQIVVQDNPTQGPCSITEHFEEKWKTGIDLIDTITTEVMNDAPEDMILVTDEKDETLYMLRGQKGLWLSHLQDFLMSYLDIEITK